MSPRRPTIHSTYLRIAEVMAERSTCPRANVGSVVVSQDRRLLSVGYNGAPHDVPHCVDVGCLMDGDHCVRAVHAEMNAILNLEQRAQDATMYVTHMPCIRCIAAMAQAGIRVVLYWHPYGIPEQQQYVQTVCRVLGIALQQIGGEDV